MSNTNGHKSAAELRAEARANGTQPPTDPYPNPAVRAEKINKAWELVRRGKSQAYIAEELGCSQATVSKLLKEGKQAQAPPGLEEERIIELQRNEELTCLVSERLESGEDFATCVELLRKLAREKRTLLGLDAPKRLNLTTTPEPTARELELARLVRELQEKHEQGKEPGPRRQPRRSRP
ncbi:MAG TPA: hypothetical protein VGD73_28755 [Pseudonocardia sp.]|jgi:predicted transcriptional regulator|uniref:hypothetical protein n=1 Tax=Pseudonocardia sp. TaxID=60912 RepID=UPI002ED7DBE0